ncbi:YbaK/EbsC family protein [Streptomyces sp. NPDC059740]|uniref:YbaK/EbsC family protein n=1 Tax=Streptomyces sp. NPDC059740 TaxID=3346926 RepID=UPI00364A395F
MFVHPEDAFEDVTPAVDRLDLLPTPVADALRAWEGPGPVEELLFVDSDPAVADTAVFAERHPRWPLETSANCVVVAGKRQGEVTYAACLVPSHTKVDVNGAVRRRLGARKASFAPMDTAVSATGMECGGITPVGLPADWALLVDARLADLEYVLVGSGSRRGKLVLPGKALAALPGAALLDGLGLAV